MENTRTTEVTVTDPADNLFILLQFGQNSSSSFTSRKKSSGSLEDGNQDFTGHQPTHENLDACNSKHTTCQRNTGEPAPSLVTDLNKQEEARYLAMFREFYEIPATTDIA
jgi:hypothetical protein